MKNLFKIPLFFLAVLLFSACGEDCGRTNHKNADEFGGVDTPAIFFSILNEQGDTLLPEKIYLIESSEDKSTYGVRKGYTSRLTLHRPIGETMYFEIILDWNEESSTLAVESQVINEVEDCDPYAFYRIYYNGILVHTCDSDEIKTPFTIQHN